MLQQLKVNNIALIEDATLILNGGLTVFSGETGTGKTALLFSLKLLIGERADALMVRDGASQALVEGVFILDGATIRVKRRLGADGRSRCWINDEQVTVATLASRIGPLIDLHGQHEHQTLLAPASHVRFLDKWIGEKAACAHTAYEDAFRAFTNARRTYDETLRAAHASANDLEVAHFTLSEIRAVAPEEGEYEALEQELPTLQHADALMTAATLAYEALHTENGAGEQIAAAIAGISREAGIDARLDALAERLEELLVQSEDLSSDLRAYRDALDFDPELLAGKLERLGALDGLRKRFGPRMEDVFARAREAARTIELSDSSGELLAQAKIALDACDEHLVAVAAQLADIRLDASDGFCAALTQAVASLGMESSSFMLAMTELPRNAWSVESHQHIELLYSPGTGITPRPLAKIASGGELSRVMLALKGAVKAAGDVTLVFDEVDAGIGGATASLVANRLRELGETNQVLVVTHLPQVAVLAHEQLVVEKRVENGGTPHTVIREVVGEERVAEVARMLSGEDAGLSLEHAREMLERGRAQE